MSNSDGAAGTVGLLTGMAATYWLGMIFATIIGWLLIGLVAGAVLLVFGVVWFVGQVREAVSERNPNLWLAGAGLVAAPIGLWITWNATMGSELTASSPGVPTLVAWLAGIFATWGWFVLPALTMKVVNSTWSRPAFAGIAMIVLASWLVLGLTAGWFHALIFDDSDVCGRAIETRPGYCELFDSIGLNTRT